MAGYFDLAEYYSHDHAFDFDLPLYEYYARQCGSPILELACGTGRLTVPLAQSGYQLYGLDSSRAMLAHCQAAVAQYDLHDLIQLHLADMTDFELPRHDFALIFCALRSFMHLLTTSEQKACLGGCHRHLRHGGLLLIDIIAPELEELAQEIATDTVKRSEFRLPSGNRVLRQIYLQAHDSVAQVRHFRFKFEEYDRAGRLLRVKEVPVRTRYTFRYEMQLLLEDAGFELVDLFRDYERAPYDGSGEMIVVAKR